MSPLLQTLSIAAVISLVGCTNPDGSQNQAGTGALIGGVAGAALGDAVGDNPRTTVIGGVIGAAIGGAIGADLDAQERQLNQQLAGSGATITNNGTQLMVVLPENVTFPTGSSVVNTAFLPALRQVALSLQSYPNSTVQVVGHTDNVGTAAYNMQLSLDRALAVARILIADGVPSSRIRYGGRGFDQPIASNATASGRAQNRRVEIIITPNP